MDKLDRIRPLIEKKVQSLGLELYEIKYIRGGRSILRVYIDKESGVTIDDCELVSNELSMLLDVEEFSRSPYTLEVSSPGLDRPLLSTKDFRREIGRQVKLRVQKGDQKVRTISGKLLTCDDSQLQLEVNKNETITIDRSEILSGKVQVTFH
ncbi:MAG: ribosome maturation factor RimP [Fibrobacterota bacterium]